MDSYWGYVLVYNEIMINMFFFALYNKWSILRNRSTELVENKSGNRDISLFETVVRGGNRLKYFDDNYLVKAVKCFNYNKKPSKNLVNGYLKMKLC